MNKRSLFAISGAIGGLISALFYLSFFENDAFASWVYTGATDAALIGTALVYVQNFYQSRDWKNFSGVFSGLWSGLMIGAVGGFAAYMFVNVLGASDITRLMGWAISGAVAGYVASVRVPNLEKKVGIIAGAIGGAAGCLVMYINLGYVVGVCVTGAAIGFMVVASEQALRKLSLDVTIRPSGLTLEKPRTFNLTIGKRPLTVGYNNEVDIQLPASPDVTMKHIADIVSDADGVYFLNRETGERSEIKMGHKFNYKNVDLSLA